MTTLSSADDVKNIFQKARVGDVVQMYWLNTPHTALISALTDSGVYFFEANCFAEDRSSNSFPSAPPYNSLDDNKVRIPNINNHYYSYAKLAERYQSAGTYGGFSIYRFGEETPITPIITTTDLPDAYIGEPYYAQIEVTGTKPITYTCNMTAISNGFRLDGSQYECTTGIINGTPINPQSRNLPYTININITATNSAGSDTKSFSVTVKANGIPIDSEHFPDRNFRNYIWTMLNNDGNDYLNDSEIANVKEINISGRNISDLTGIKYFTALERLFCQENSIQNLDVGGMENLSLIQAWDNGMITLQISGCTSLSDLWIHTNDLTTILADNCPKLKRVCMWTNTKLASLNLSSMASLEELWAAGCTSLRNLYVSKNPKMTSLYVDQCSALERISATGSSSINSINLDGCNNLKTFERESNVSVPGNKPEITTTSLPDGYVGEAYSARIMATSTHPITGYEISPIGMSNGLQCDPETGEITGKPTTERTFSMTLYVSNYVGTTPKTFDVTIKTRAIAPFITTSKLPSANILRKANCNGYNAYNVVSY